MPKRQEKKPCSRCGRSVEYGFLFCKHCGSLRWSNISIELVGGMICLSMGLTLILAGKKPDPLGYVFAPIGFLTFYHLIRGLIVAAERKKALKDEYMQRAENPMVDYSTILQETKICPVCAESIKLEVEKCLFCGYEFAPSELTKALELKKILKDDPAFCPKCKKTDSYIDAMNRLYCPNCREYVLHVTGHQDKEARKTLYLPAKAIIAGIIAGNTVLGAILFLLWYYNDLKSFGKAMNAGFLFMWLFIFLLIRNRAFIKSTATSLKVTLVGSCWVTAAAYLAFMKISKLYEISPRVDHILTSFCFFTWATGLAATYSATWNKHFVFGFALMILGGILMLLRGLTP